MLSVCVLNRSVVGQLFVTPWTAACQAPLSIQFSRQEYWNGLPCPSAGDLPNPGFEHQSPELQADSLLTELPGRLERLFLSISIHRSLSRVQLFATPWTVAHQAPPSMGFSRQEYWNGLPFPSPGDLPDLGIKPCLLYCRQILYRLSHQGSPRKGSPGKAYCPWWSQREA